MAVHAIPTAPSTSAASAEGVAQAAVNSGWWLTAPPASIASIGWMAGIPSETLAMSVEPTMRSPAGPRSGNSRPSAVALAT